MNYSVIESRLHTNKTKNYLWNKINSPEKVALIEEFKEFKFKKISENNYEFYFGERLGFMTFSPKRTVTMMFIKDNDSSLAWFEIQGEENCELVHGTSVRIDDDDGKWFQENEVKLKEHFLEELRKIAK